MPSNSEWTRTLCFNTVTNGGFERGVGDGKTHALPESIFRNDPEASDASSDTSVCHSGGRSLKLLSHIQKSKSLQRLANSRGRTGPSIQTQLLGSHRKSKERRRGRRSRSFMEMMTRSSPLRRSLRPALTTGKRSSAPSDFTAPDNCYGVTIRTVRAYRGDDCPITGTLWYDDFELKKIN
ncbi:MAG: hypothetical protein IPQ00_00110 [Chloracidobacterium sp.]|nr:hypothetical protein [Chloracidobacterium sp.]